MNNKVVAYIRYSTENQRNGYTLDIQRAAIESYCDISGLTVVAEFVDSACSGTTDERPQFRAMIEQATTDPELSVIVVYDLSRFSRNYDDATRYLSKLKAHGVSVVSVRENYNAYIDSILKDNEDYVKEVSRTTRAGLALKAKEGKHCGGKPPFGYDISSTGELVINEAEADVVRSIFDSFASGYGYSEIESMLKQQGIKNRSGNEFNRRSFVGMLKQKKYIGKVTWRTTSADGEEVIIVSTCPAIIDKAVFDKAQELIKSRAGGKGTKSSKSRTLFSNSSRIICGECGAVLKVKQRTPTKGKRYCLYYCPNHVKGECKQKEIKSRDVDRFTAVCITNFIFKQKNITNVDKPDRKELKCMVAKHLTKPTNSHVRDLIEILDVHVTVDTDNIKIDFMSESM